MVDIDPIMSTIALNVNGLNISIKKQRLSENQGPITHCPEKTHSTYKDTQIIKVERWREIYLGVEATFRQ